VTGRFCLCGAALHWSCNLEDSVITTETHRAHGLDGALEAPDWPPLTTAEVDTLLRRYPQAGGAERLLSFSPRPFSAASVVAAPAGKVFVKRHHCSIRDREGLLEEHRFIAHLIEAQWPGGSSLVAPILADVDGETAVTRCEWIYEVHRLAQGVDVYEQAVSWTPFLHPGHAYAAGTALAKLHRASAGYDAPARKPRPLVSSFMIFAGDEAYDGGAVDDAVMRMEAFLERRPLLRDYAERRGWRGSFDQLFLPLYDELRPWLPYLSPLWTQNDLHASNLMWSGDGEHVEAVAIIDFGLADRTNFVHDLATAIERNIIEWLRISELGAEIVHLDHLDALLAGYHDSRPVSYEEARALVAILPLVHCEFALSEADYFLAILHDEAKAYLAYEGYFLAHAQWFLGAQGRRLLEHLKRWAEHRMPHHAVSETMTRDEEIR
jgi:Ser/Thr protein kinase RdoA (MazF antagonist)